MTVMEIIEKTGMKLLTSQTSMDVEINDVYICDLLSRVMANAPSKGAWITVHTHPNVVAVAMLAEISCIILPETIEPEKETLNRAVENDIPVLSSNLSGYKICTQLYNLLGCET